MIDQELVALLACPETQQAVSLGSTELLNNINQAIKKGQLRNRDQKIIKELCNAILIREDNKYCYPVINNIPVLIVDEGIEVSSIPS